MKNLRGYQTCESLLKFGQYNDLYANSGCGLLTWLAAKPRDDTLGGRLIQRAPKADCLFAAFKCYLAASDPRVFKVGQPPSRLIVNVQAVNRFARECLLSG